MRSRLENQFHFLPKMHSYKFIHNSLTGLGDHYFAQIWKLKSQCDLEKLVRVIQTQSALNCIYTHISGVRIRQLVQQKPGIQMSVMPM